MGFSAQIELFLDSISGQSYSKIIGLNADLPKVSPETVPYYKSITESASVLQSVSVPG